ncbi:diguanylate cyclase domain-containing protein [Sphingomonas sp. MMS24-JH45]
MRGLLRPRRPDPRRERQFPEGDGLCAARGDGPASQHLRRSQDGQRRRNIADCGSGCARGSICSSKFRRIARDGSEVSIQATYNPIYDLNGRPFKIVKIATDITADVSLAADLSRAQREVQHDAATGLPDRLGLRRFLRTALAATDSQLALLYLDLDHFKPINDTFGHDVGDYC